MIAEAQVTNAPRGIQRVCTQVPVHSSRARLVIGIVPEQTGSIIYARGASAGNVNSLL